MGILGLTHDGNGAALEKLPVTIKVAIGEGPTPDDENGSPRALFHFVFKRKTMRGQSVYWETAPDIAEVFGEKPTELAVIFLHDDPREVCPSEYALCADRQRERAALRNASNPKDNGAPRGGIMAGQSQVCGWTDERAANRRMW